MYKGIEDMESCVEIKNLRKKYKNFELFIDYLRIPSGKIIGLIGENGAGKSTLIQLMLNIISKNSGTIRIDGMDHIENQDILKQNIGVVFDECCFPGVLNVNELGIIMKNIYAEWDHECYKKYIQRFELSEKKDIEKFSKGMKMKLSLAIALSHNPKLLIMDESTSALDPIVRDEVIDLLEEYVHSGNKTVLFSSHIISDIQRMANYVIFLHQGRIAFMEEKEELTEKYLIIHCIDTNLERIAPKAIAILKESAGYQLLVRKNEVEIESGTKVEKASLEDIMLFMIRGEKTNVRVNN